MVLLRQLVAVDGPARVRVMLDVRAGFGRHPAADLHRTESGWRGASGSVRWHWAGLPDARPDGDGRLVAELTVPAGGRHDLVLAMGEAVTGAPDATTCWRRTEDAWRSDGLSPNTIAERDVRHAHAVLRGMSTADGGMVAAATASLPERAEAGRNYDYRYVWIRDQAMTAQAAATGANSLLDGATRFLTARLLDHGDQLSPAYTVDGDSVPAQRHLGLPGYPGGSDVVGNRARQQFQLDVFGEALLALGAAERAGRLDAAGRKAIEVAAEAIERRWQEPDAGIWELDPRRWTHSRLICAAGLRAVRGIGDRWAGLADALVTDAATWGTHPSGRWQRAADDPTLDAALVIAGIRGATPVGDPRDLATLQAYVARLTCDGFAFRFEHEGRALGEAEGAFLLCGFMLAIAVHQHGDTQAAVRWFERNRTACGPAGLFSEEYDVAQRQLRGNLPQAFVHGALMEAAAVLSRPAAADPLRPDPVGLDTTG
ncbi:glycoside hydrolase [Actinocatenispora thailandica]|uniref:Glycoside hydrolase n=1 Tax=Actinocatenispora thailandica TaxID=227318 RepID=A0A7R7HVY1_9ACTN|nr:glycoside hydrolase family 15 protein [Actinocatenispora thailandica]BCJ34131.1 glycoside hydrolase [Actinocatenispora thailandica]